jgi:hypothetical protein
MGPYQHSVRPESDGVLIDPHSKATPILAARPLGALTFNPDAAKRKREQDVLI